jgi:hypothetical protein
MIAGYLLMDILEFGHNATNQTNTTQTPAGVIKISDKEAREHSTIPYIDPNPVPFTTLRLSTPDPSSGPGGAPLTTCYHNKKQYKKHSHF